MKYLKSCGFIPCFLAILCLFLMLTTCAAYIKEDSFLGVLETSGQDILFSRYHSKSYGALCAFNCLSFAIILLGVGIMLPFIKNKKTFNDISGVLFIFSMLLILVAAISIRFVPLDIYGTSYFDHSDKIEMGLGGGYNAVSIISFVSVVLCVPPIIGCFKKEEQAI